MTRPGTRESSVRAESFPTAASRRPVRPGEPAVGSPRLRATTLSESQKTPEKPQGSEVKSQEEKKEDPGMSKRDFRMDCSARKSSGSKIARPRKI